MVFCLDNQSPWCFKWQPVTVVFNMITNHHISHDSQSPFCFMWQQMPKMFRITTSLCVISHDDQSPRHFTMCYTWLPFCQKLMCSAWLPSIIVMVLTVSMASSIPLYMHACTHTHTRMYVYIHTFMHTHTSQIIVNTACLTGNIDRKCLRIMHLLGHFPILGW